MTKPTPREQFDTYVWNVREILVDYAKEALELAKEHDFPLESLEGAVQEKEDYIPCSEDFEESLTAYLKMRKLKFWCDWQIYLEKPIDEETKQDLIRRFDGSNQPWDTPKP